MFVIRILIHTPTRTHKQSSFPSQANKINCKLLLHKSLCVLSSYIKLFHYFHCWGEGDNNRNAFFSAILLSFQFCFFTFLRLIVFVVVVVWFAIQSFTQLKFHHLHYQHHHHHHLEGLKENFTVSSTGNNKATVSQHQYFNNNIKKHKQNGNIYYKCAHT